MTTHSHQHSGHEHAHHHGDHEHGHGSGHDEHGGDHGHADLMDLDAEVFGSYLDDVADRVGRYVPHAPRTVIDLGAGTGPGTLALARRFTTAEVVAIDMSELLLERLRVAAQRRGASDRLRVVQADVDQAWPEVGAADVVWASSSLHHVADPDRVLRDVHGSLNPGGLLAVIEMDSLPCFLPDDIGLGRPGLEARCHGAVARANWNAHPDWRPYLERAGFEVVEQRSFTTEASRTENTGRLAHGYLSRIRSALGDQLDTDDLRTLDHLLADDHPDALTRRGDLVARSDRTVWMAHRP